MSSGRDAAPLVLMYHSVNNYEKDPHLVTVTPWRFERQMAWLERRGLRGVSVRELLDARRDGLARGLVGLTFDDGYADFATRVVPMLSRFGFTATAYVVADRIGADNIWDEPPRKPLMTADQLAGVHGAGMEVASHGLGHVSLRSLADDEVADELVRSRRLLSDIVGEPVTGFAYPYGEHGPRETAAVRDAGYEHAVAVDPPEPSTFALPRTYVGERDGTLRLLAKLRRHELRRKERV